MPGCSPAGSPAAAAARRGPADGQSRAGAGGGAASSRPPPARAGLHRGSEVDRGKTAGWQGCGRMSPSGDDPVSCPRPPHPPRRRDCRHFIPRRALGRPPPAALPRFARCGQSSRGRPSGGSAPAQRAGPWGGGLVSPPPRVSLPNLIS